MTVRAVLLDADGVMQRNPAGWHDEVTAVVPEADRERFAEELWTAEEPAQAGRRTFADVLAELGGRWGITNQQERLLALWRQVDVVDEMVQLVRVLRAGGTPVHLVTNQNDVRAAYLREELGYDALFDRLFVSCELGRTKRDDGFFDLVVREVGLPAEELLLVDDSADHVASARAAGLQAECWSLDDGVPALRALLARLLR